MKCMKMPSNRRISRYIISSILLLGGWCVALGQDTTTVAKPKGFVADKIIGKIDNYIILRSELEGAFQNYLANGGQNTEEAKCGIFSQLVINKLLVAKAEIDSVLITDLEVDNNTDQRMNMIMQQSGNSTEQLEIAYGKPLEQIKLDLREQIREQMLGGEMQRK